MIVVVAVESAVAVKVEGVVLEGGSGCGGSNGAGGGAVM